MNEAEEDSISVLMEYLEDWQTLKHFYNRSKETFSEDHVATIVYQVLIALDLLNKLKIANVKLDLDSILIDQIQDYVTLQIKLFGFSTAI